ncbi:MAG: hypothetical protein LBS51_05965 [Oscillospiraceae bacterium]|nr:hypothetical protein [Oscillospiraceae bacterium]
MTLRQIRAVAVLVITVAFIAACSGAGGPYEPNAIVGEISLRGAVTLAADESAECLDVFGDRALLSVNRRFTPDEPEFREEGYNAETVLVMVYNHAAGIVEKTADIGRLRYVASGALSGRGFAFTTVVWQSQEASERGAVTVELYGGGERHISVDVGMYATTGYGDPRIVRLGDGYAFTYCEDMGMGEFGVKTLSSEGEIETALALETPDGHFLSNDILSDGGGFVYFAEVNERGTLFLGGNGPIRSFSLAADERMNAYALTAESVFLSIERVDDENAHISYEIAFVDFNGRRTARDVGVNAYYKRILTGGWGNGVVAQYHTGEVHVIWSDGGAVKTKTVDMPPNPAALFTADASVVYAYYPAGAGDAGTLSRIENSPVR